MAGKLNELWKVGSGQPLASAIPIGGLAIDAENRSAYSRDADGNIFEIGSSSGGLPDDTGKVGQVINTRGNGGEWSPIRTNPNILTEDYSIEDGVSGSATDGFTIEDNVTLTIPDGSVFSIV